MLEKELLRITNKLRLHFYRRIFSMVRERDGSLTAMEVFAVEVIHALGKPTISEFADFIGISRSNATYKINSLVQKGYVERTPSPTDKREFILHLTRKYYDYVGLYEENFCRFILENEKKYPPEKIRKLKDVLEQISDGADWDFDKKI